MTHEQPAFTNQVQIIRRVLAINVRGLAVSNKGKLKTLNVKSELIAGVVKKNSCDLPIMESEATAVVKRSRSRVKDLQGLFSRGGRWFELLRQKGFGQHHH